MAARAAALTLAAALLLTGCGADDPPGAVESVPPPAPADLCALVPASVSRGLESSSSSDDGGDPRAVCSLRSTSGDRVRAVVTWLQLEDENPADVVLRSQCAAIDRSRLDEPAGFEVEGAAQTCAGTRETGGDDVASVAVRRGREVLTVRVDSSGGTPALRRSQQLLEGVLAELDTGR